jgi:hypothetical protein
MVPGAGYALRDIDARDTTLTLGGTDVTETVQD